MSESQDPADASSGLPVRRPVRRAARVALTAVVASSLALSGCTSQEKPRARPTTSTSTTPAVTPTPEPFTAKGLPAELAAVIRPIYLGGNVPSSPLAAKALLKRKAGPSTVTVTGAVSRWKNTPVAVITSGKDVTLAVAAPKWRVVGGWWPSLGVSAPTLGGTRRVLVIGSDARPGENVFRSRGDSLHILGFDGRGGGGIVGIPRDSYVPLATGGRGKINSALTFGGPDAELRTVRGATGVPLEGYVITGFDGFTRLVDAIHGLPITIPKAIKDSFSGANVVPGPTRLNGGAALSYARARHGVEGGDFGRSANQGLVVLAAGAFAKLAGPLKLPGILHATGRLVATNLSAEQILTLSASALAVSPRRVHTGVAAGGFGMTPDGQSIVLWDGHARALFADIRDGNLS